MSSSGPFTCLHEKLLVLSGAQKRKDSAVGPDSCASCSAARAIDPADPKVLEVAVAGRVLFGDFGKAPRGVPQRRRLGFGSKTLPSSVGDGSPFERKALGLPLGLSMV